MSAAWPQVKGKCNAISIDKCQKTGVVFEDVIATCELVNCTSMQVRTQAQLVLCTLSQHSMLSMSIGSPKWLCAFR